MKNYEEMAQNALSRIDEYNIMKKKRRNTIVKISAPIMSLAIVALVGIGIYKQNTPPTTALPNTSNSDITIENTTTQDISAEFPTNSTEQLPSIHMTQSMDDLCQPFDSESWIDIENYMSISNTFYNKYNRMSDSDILDIYIVPSINWEYEYNGNTINDYYVIMSNIRVELDKMGTLLKMGEDLKYGEALCTTGNAEGIKWDTNLYNETVSSIGDELIKTYIVNGEFLKDDLENDYSACEQKIKDAETNYNDARYVYVKEIADEVGGTTDYPGRIFMTLNKSEIAQLLAKEGKFYRMGYVFLMVNETTDN